MLVKVNRFEPFENLSTKQISQNTSKIKLHTCAFLPPDFTAGCFKPYSFFMGAGGKEESFGSFGSVRPYVKLPGFNFHFPCPKAFCI